MKLKNNLKSLLEGHEITLTELAKETGVPKQTIHNWLCGTEPKSLGHVRPVAKYFDLTIEELCFGDEEKKSVSEKSTFETYEEEIKAGIFEVILRKVKK